MQINSTRSGNITDTAVNQQVISNASGNSLTSRLSGQSASRQTKAVSQPERFNRWTLIGSAQQKISASQSSEQALAIAYRQLKQLERQLNQNQQVSSQLRQQLAELDEAIAGDDGELTPDLKPKILSPDGNKSAYVLDKVDLLSTKAGSEKLKFFFPSTGHSSTVEIPANATTDDVLIRLQTGLASERIDVQINNDGLLQFSVITDNKRKLDEPVFFSGEGVRIPGGNPIPIKLTPADSELNKLGQGLSAGDIREEQNRLQKLLGNIESSMRELKKFRKQMLLQMERAKSQSIEIDEKELARLQQELKQQLGSGDFNNTYSGLLTQANVSRQNVVALLGNNTTSV